MLPKYNKPPVIEVAVGVQFEPLARWTVAHLGLLWSYFRDELPTIELKSTIEGPADDFQALPGRLKFELQRVQFPEARCWYVNESRNHLIQVQHDRFIFNWRKLSSQQEYPGYEEFIRPQFLHFWSGFLEFLTSENIERPHVIQCETTYVNQIERGEAWSSVEDWADVFTVVQRNEAAKFLPPVETDHFSKTYRLSDPVGRLRINCSLVVKQADGSQAISLTLIARNKPESDDTETLLGSFDTGRAWIVQGFTDITTPKMHKMWERKS